MKLLGSSKAEAIQLASELVIAGHRVRIGLAGIDTRDLDKLGVSIADAFEPCRNLNTAVRLISESPAKLKPSSTPARVEARDNAKTASTSVRGSRAGKFPNSARPGLGCLRPGAPQFDTGLWRPRVARLPSPPSSDPLQL